MLRRTGHAEEMRHTPCGKDEEVVGKRLALSLDHTGREVHRPDVGHHKPDGRQLPQDASDGVRDLFGFQLGCGYLVQQREEGMVVTPIDEESVNRTAGKGARRPQSSEAASDDHHARTVMHPRSLQLLPTSTGSRVEANVPNQSPLGRCRSSAVRWPLRRAARLAAGPPPGTPLSNVALARAASTGTGRSKMHSYGPTIHCRRTYSFRCWPGPPKGALNHEAAPVDLHPDVPGLHARQGRCDHELVDPTIHVHGKCAVHCARSPFVMICSPTSVREATTGCVLVQDVEQQIHDDPQCQADRPHGDGDTPHPGVWSLRDTGCIICQADQQIVHDGRHRED